MSFIRTIIRKAGTIIGQRRTINLIEGNAISLVMADNPATDSVDVEVGVSLALSNYYFYKEASGIGSYYLMKIDASPDPVETIANSGINDGDTLASFITETGYPNVTLLPSGVLKVRCYATKTGGTKTAQLYAEFYRYKLDTTEILLATSGYSTVLGGVEAQYNFSAVLTDDTVILNTTRILVKIKAYVTSGGSKPAITLSMEDDRASRIELGVVSASLSGKITGDGVAKITVGTTTPTSPSVGDLWVDTN